MNGINHSGYRRGGDTASFLRDACLSFVVSCAGTLAWLAVLTWTWQLGWPVAFPTLLLFVGVVVAVCPGVPSETRRMARQLLPVIGDVDRWRRRRARRRGNSWLRESSLVRDPAHVRPTSYRVWLWPDRLIIESLPVVGVDDSTIRKAVAASLDAWGMADCEVTHTGPGSWIVRLYHESRLASLGEPRMLNTLPSVDAGSGRLRVRVGRGLHGDTWLNLAEVSGLMVSGLPGGGKSACMLTLVCGLLSVPSLVEVYVADGKGGGDWSWLAPYCTAYTDDGIDSTLDMLRNVQTRMERQLRFNRDGGHPDFWHGYGDANHGPVIVVVLDEVQTWATPASADREDKAKAAKFVRIASDIARRGRAAGVVLVMSTQKPTSDSIPTSLRDVCSVRLAFRCSTREMARAALGILPDNGPDPTLIPRESPGLAVIADGGDASYFRCDLLPRTVAARDLYELRWADVWNHEASNASS